MKIRNDRGVFIPDKKIEKLCLVCGSKFFLTESLSKRCKYCSKKCYWKFLVGRTTPKGTKIKMSVSQKSRSRKPQENENLKVGVKYRFCNGHKLGLGRHVSEETKIKISSIQQGIKVEGWRGFITPENVKIRNSDRYKQWRRKVFERDRYTCVWCGDNTGGNLEADHIKSFALHPKLRFVVDNGRTLCHTCHMNTDNYLYKSRWGVENLWHQR